MKTLAQIQQQLTAGRFDFSRHAFKRAIERNISEQEIRRPARERRSSRNIQRTSPSVLLLGFTSAGRPLHIQVPAADSDETRIITLYEPDPTKWVELRKRR